MEAIHMTIVIVKGRATAHASKPAPITMDFTKVKNHPIQSFAVDHAVANGLLPTEEQTVTCLQCGAQAPASNPIPPCGH